MNSSTDKDKAELTAALNKLSGVHSFHIDIDSRRARVVGLATASEIISMIAKETRFRATQESVRLIHS